MRIVRKPVCTKLLIDSVLMMCGLGFSAGSVVEIGCCEVRREEKVPMQDGSLAYFAKEPNTVHSNTGSLMLPATAGVSHPWPPLSACKTRLSCQATNDAKKSDL